MIKSASFQLIAACALLAGCTGADHFSGIYSVTDPVSGLEVDRIKVVKNSGTNHWPGVPPYRFYVRAEGNGEWTPGGGADKPAAGSVQTRGAPFTASPGADSLQLAETGQLYSVPEGAISPYGRSPSGYIFNDTRSGVLPVQRRPLVQAPGPDPYRPAPGQRRVAVRAINYSAFPVEVTVSSPTAPDNVVHVDLASPFTASTPACCFYLDAPGRRENLSIVLRGRSKAEPTSIILPAPPGRTPRTLWIVVHDDERIEAVLPQEEPGARAVVPPDPAWPGAVRRWPAPSADYRLHRLVARLKFHLQLLADMEALPAAADPIQSAARQALTSRQRSAVEYLSRTTQCPVQDLVCAARRELHPESAFHGQ